MTSTEDQLRYPLVFAPIYQRRMWGGALLSEMLHRELPPQTPGDDPVGEAWEMVDRDDAQSVVVNGALQGMSLGDLTRDCGEALIGPSYKTGRKFPLLIKLIDAGDKLSLQVHPDENFCLAAQDGSEPKTELWYIVGATTRGEIMAGLSPRTTRSALLENLHNQGVRNLLQVYASHRGDSYFIVSGTLHAIGEGNLILEIQQNSDTTFRVSDWGRVGLDGQPRKLHVEQGLRAIDFQNRVSPRIPAVVGDAKFNRRITLAERHCFRIENLLLVQPDPENTRENSGSCHVLSVGRGRVQITGEGFAPVDLSCGQSALIPATLGNYTLTPQDGSCEVLKTTLN